jgi:shikimate dehydrogenase
VIRLGLIGYPVGHSLSPKIQAAALDAFGLEGEYVLFPIATGDQKGLKELLARVHCGEITGLNVTIPHKQNVIPLLDELSLTAQAIGAVNTISMQNGKLIGDNTDAPGFLADLKHFIRIWKSKIENRKSVLVLGAGGSARAVIYALVSDGWEITIAARRLEQAKALVTQFPKSDSRLSGIEYQTPTLHSLLPTLSLIVNTTPVGMSPSVDSSPWPAKLPFLPNAAVYDLVYNPRETKLVKDARAAGLPATTGLGMLIEQAVLSFEIWTGCKPSRHALIAAVH